MFCVPIVLGCSQPLPPGESRGEGMFNHAGSRKRAGASICAVKPNDAMRAGSGKPRAKAAQASPIAGDVWMP